MATCRDLSYAVLLGGEEYLENQVISLVIFLKIIANEIAGRGRKKLLCKLSRVGYTITNVNKFSYIFFGIMIGCVRSINGL
jgi:hypothetical protein